MGVLATDDFNRADNADLGVNWTPVDGSFQIISNQAITASLDADAIASRGVSW
jgi:hypothetical protein